MFEDDIAYTLSNLSYISETDALKFLDSINSEELISYLEMKYKLMETEQTLEWIPEDIISMIKTINNSKFFLDMYTDELNIYNEKLGFNAKPVNLKKNTLIVPDSLFSQLDEVKNHPEYIGFCKMLNNGETIIVIPLKHFDVITAFHEAIHSAAYSELGTGFQIDEMYRGINEGATEFLAKDASLSLSSRISYKPIVDVYSSLSSILNMESINDIKTIGDLYYNHDVKGFESLFKNILGNTEEVNDLWNNS